MTIVEAKIKLAELVAQKIDNTCKRLALKAIPFVTRTPSQHSSMLQCWGIGSDLKGDIRHASLAYMFLRGRKYWTVERHCKAGPYATAVAYYAGALVEDVEAWIMARPTSEELSQYELHLQRTKEKLRTRPKYVRVAA